MLAHIKTVLEQPGRAGDAIALLSNIDDLSLIDALAMAYDHGKIDVVTWLLKDKLTEDWIKNTEGVSALYLAKHSLILKATADREIELVKLLLEVRPIEKKIGV